MADEDDVLCLCLCLCRPRSPSPSYDISKLKHQKNEHVLSCCASALVKTRLYRWLKILCKECFFHLEMII